MARDISSRKVLVRFMIVSYRFSWLSVSGSAILCGPGGLTSAGGLEWKASSSGATLRTFPVWSKNTPMPAASWARSSNLCPGSSRSSSDPRAVLNVSASPGDKGLRFVSLALMIVAASLSMAAKRFSRSPPSLLMRSLSRRTFRCMRSSSRSM